MQHIQANQDEPAYSLNSYILGWSGIHHRKVQRLRITSGTRCYIFKKTRTQKDWWEVGEIREQVWDLIRSSSSGTKWDRINSYKMKITIWFSLSSVPLTSYKTYTAFLPSQQMTIKGGWIVFIEYWGKSYFSYLVIGPSRVGLAVCLVMKLSGSLRSAGKESLLLISSCSYKLVSGE